MSQDILDLVIVVTLVLFTIRGIRNGLIGEVAGIFSLVGGFWAARAWNGDLAAYLTFIEDPSWRIIASCVLIFIAVMLGIGLIARILKKIVSYSFAGWLDKIGGALLGLAKGILLWALLFIVLANLFQNAPFLQQSRSYPYFQHIIAQIQPYLPESIANKIGI